jgi:hypothetical protein
MHARQNCIEDAQKDLLQEYLSAQRRRILRSTVSDSLYGKICK